LDLPAVWVFALRLMASGPAIEDVMDHENPGFYPGMATLEAVGDCGFRFAGMGHRGSILILPSGIHAWPPLDGAALSPADFATVLAEQDGFDFLLIGTGSTFHVLPPGVTELLSAAGFAVEAMSTRAAARTHTVLFAEHRRVAAALIATA
jgi:uncharacterized protein